MWLLRRLARGGMGEVYLAASGTIEGAERPCVVKIIRRDHASDRSFLARFLDEARVQAQLQHPGIAQVLEAAVDPGGEPYVVVEYVEGRSLGEVRGRAMNVGYKLAWPDALALGAALAEALAHTHERTDAHGKPLGIVHRDLSPQNVMLGYGGDLKLIDFGTARAENRRCRTISGVVYAKPGYVAPEIANGQPGDFRVDLYALGIMLWELLAGHRFLVGDAAEHLAAVARGERTPPAIAERAGAPAELDDLLARLFAHNPDERFPSTSRAVGEIMKILSRAPSLPNGERGVRARIALLLSNLYPAEPSRSRAEFQRLVRAARSEMVERQAASAPASGSGSNPGLEADANESPDPNAPNAGLVPGPGADAAAAPCASAGAKATSAACASAAKGPSSAASVGMLADPFPPGLPPLPRPVDSGKLPGTPYDIVREIGRGGMGIVYEAVHTELLRRVALKVLPLEHRLGSGYAEAFRREARSIARLNHPNLVAVHEFGQAADGRLYCAMELVKGETLEQRVMRVGVLDWEEVVALGVEACRGLEAAHKAGVLHRDLKPSNLLVCHPDDNVGHGVRAGVGLGTIKLLDFGIAEIRSEAGFAQIAAPREGKGDGAPRECVRVVGTPEYMAPEQAGGGPLDGRADLYALASALYEACTGRLPYEAKSLVGLLECKRSGRCQPMTSHATRRPIPKRLSRVIEKALAPHPEQRYESATALRQALEHVAIVEGKDRRRRSPWKPFGQGAAAALAIGCLGLLWQTGPAWLGEALAGSAAWRGSPPASLPSVDEAVSVPAATALVGAAVPAVSAVAPVAAPVASAMASVMAPAVTAPPSRSGATISPVRSPDPASSVAPERGRPADQKPTEKRASTSPSRLAEAVHARAHDPHDNAGQVVPASDPWAHASMLREARAAASRGDVAQAIELFRLLSGAYPTDAAVLRGWAEAAASKQDWTEAQRAAERWQMVDAGIEPKLYLARMLTHAGREADAVATLRRLLESHPECDEARAMLHDRGVEFPPARGESSRAAADKGAEEHRGAAQERGAEGESRSEGESH